MRQRVLLRVVVVLCPDHAVGGRRSAVRLTDMAL